jgi:hypothetical protein
MDANRDPSSDSPIEPDETASAPQPKIGQPPDPGDEVPVPPAMSAAEIDERAQVVEKLRREHEPPAGDPELEP